MAPFDLEKLRALWNNLEFWRVQRVKPHADGRPFTGYAVKTGKEGSLARFESGTHHSLNFTHFTLWWESYPRPELTEPDPDTLLCGTVRDDGNGAYFTRWFVCDRRLVFLHALVFDPSRFNQLIDKLLSDGRPTIYWVLAQLLIRDDVEAVVSGAKLPTEGLRDDQLHLFTRRPGTFYIEDWVSRMVHLLSFLFGTDWFERFWQLACSEGIQNFHWSVLPELGEDCFACDKEFPPTRQRPAPPYSRAAADLRVSQ